MNINDLEKSLEDKVNDLSVRVRPQVDQARRRLQSLGEQATALVQEHPAASLLGAAALGYLIARLGRRR